MNSIFLKKSKSQSQSYRQPIKTSNKFKESLQKDGQGCEIIDLKLKSFIKILNKTNRNLIDVQMISLYLSKLKGLVELLSDSYENPSEILTMIGTVMNYSYSEENKLLFRVGI